VSASACGEISAPAFHTAEPHVLTTYSRSTVISSDILPTNDSDVFRTSDNSISTRGSTYRRDS
jgi:hypothetical protein